MIARNINDIYEEMVGTDSGKISKEAAIRFANYWSELQRKIDESKMNLSKVKSVS